MRQYAVIDRGAARVGEFIASVFSGGGASRDGSSRLTLTRPLDVPERERLQSWMQAPGVTYVSSRLLRTEVVRVLRRDGRSLADGAPLLDRVGMFEITRETHAVAESIGRHVKTLDALHLATALLIGAPVTVASHDATMKAVAEHLGLAVTDPVDRGP